MPQIIPIKDLKNTAEISDLCHKTDGPVFITKNGYGDMVIMSMEMYERILEKVKLYHDIEQSEEQIQNGQTLDARASLNALRTKYGL